MEKDTCEADFESAYLKKIIEGERIFAAKAKVYSKLLTDMSLASNMEELSSLSEQTRAGLEALLTGEKQEEGSEE